MSATTIEPVPVYDDLLDDPWFEVSASIAMRVEPPARWPVGEMPYKRPVCRRIAMVALQKP